MSLDSTDPLLDLAHVHDERPLPVEGIHRRASALRTARRRRRAALGVGSLATALAVGGVVLPQSSDEARPPALAATFLRVVPAHAADVDCSTGENWFLGRDAWAEPPLSAMLSLIPESAAGAPLRGWSSGASRMNCPPVTPAAVLYSPGPAVRGVTVWVDVANPWGDREGLQEVDVRGTTGELKRFDNGGWALSWVDAAGIRWLVEASGVDRATLVDTLDALRMDGQSVDPASVPVEWDQAPLPVATTDTSSVGWRVEYGSPGPTWTDDRLSLVVGPVTESPAVYAARDARVTFTSVHGNLAVYFPDQGGCLNWQSDQLDYQLCGSGTGSSAERMTRMAEQVEHVSPDDPRLQQAPDLRDVPDTGY